MPTPPKLQRAALATLAALATAIALGVDVASNSPLAIGMHITLAVGANGSAIDSPLARGLHVTTAAGADGSAIGSHWAQPQRLCARASEPHARIVSAGGVGTSYMKEYMEQRGVTFRQVYWGGIQSEKHGLKHKGEPTIYLVRHPLLAMLSLCSRRYSWLQMKFFRAQGLNVSPTTMECRNRWWCILDIVNSTGVDEYGFVGHFDYWERQANTSVCTLESVKQHARAVACSLGLAAGFFENFTARLESKKADDTLRRIAHLYPGPFAVYDGLWRRMKRRVAADPACGWSNGSSL